jgi:hypothetical protein
MPEALVDFIIFTNEDIYSLSLMMMFLIFLWDYNTPTLRKFCNSIYGNMVVLVYTHSVLVRAYLPAGISTFFTIGVLVLTMDIFLSNYNDIRGIIIIVFLVFMVFFSFINAMTVYYGPFTIFSFNFLRNINLRMVGAGGAAAGAGGQPDPAALVVRRPRGVYPRGSTLPDPIEPGSYLSRVMPLTPNRHGPQHQGVPGREFFRLYNEKLYAISQQPTRRLLRDPVEEYNYQQYLLFVAEGNDGADFRPSQYYYWTVRTTLSDEVPVRTYVIECPRFIASGSPLNTGVIENAGGQPSWDPDFVPSATLALGPCPKHHPANQLNRLVSARHGQGVVYQGDADQPGVEPQSFWEWLQSFFS